MNFVKNDILSSVIPESGTYIILTYSRDGIPVPRIAFLNIEYECIKKWYCPCIGEYGHAEHYEMKDTDVHAYVKFDALSYEVIPEKFNLVHIEGIKFDEDNE